MRVDVVYNGRLELRVHAVVLVDEAGSSRSLYGAPQHVNLLLHLGVLAALADALEVGFDLALELEPPATRASLKRVLYDIAT